MDRTILFMYCVSILGTECLLCFFPFMLFFCIFSHNQLFLYLYVLLHDFLVLIPHFLFCLLFIAQPAAQVCVLHLLNVVCLYNQCVLCMLASISVLISGPITVSVQRGTCHMCTDCGGPEIKTQTCMHQILEGYVFVIHDLCYCAMVTFYVCVCYCLCLMYCIIFMLH